MKWLGRINCIVGAIGFLFVVFFDNIAGRVIFDLGRFQILALIFCILLFIQGLMIQKKI